MLEAHDRLGGRILTIGETGAPDSGGFNLGSSWFWPHMQPDLAALVAELGVRSFGQHSAGDLLSERSPREPPHRANSAGQDQGSIRLAGGTGALVQALAKDLPAGCLHLNAPVTQQRLVQDGILLTIAGEGWPADYLLARHVIANLPPRLMDKAIRLDPALGPATACTASRAKLLGIPSVAL